MNPPPVHSSCPESPSFPFPRGSKAPGRLSKKFRFPEPLRGHDCIPRISISARLTEECGGGKIGHFEVGRKGTCPVPFFLGQGGGKGIGMQNSFGGRYGLSPATDIVLEQAKGGFQCGFVFPHLFLELEQAGVPVVPLAQTAVNFRPFVPGIPFELGHRFGERNLFLLHLLA